MGMIATMSNFRFIFLFLSWVFVVVLCVFFWYKSWSNFFSLSLKYGVPFIWSIRFCNFCAVRYNPNNLVQTQHLTHSWSACTLSLCTYVGCICIYVYIGMLISVRMRYLRNAMKFMLHEKWIKYCLLKSVSWKNRWMQ